MINTETLRAVAGVLPQHPWNLYDGYEGPFTWVIGPRDFETVATVRAGCSEISDEYDMPNVARFMSTFDPPTVLALLDTIDSLRAEVARLQGADDGR